MAHLNRDSWLSNIASNKRLSADTRRHITTFLQQTDDEKSWRIVIDLIEQQQWQDLTDRFYKMPVFGTGGIRGRTIMDNAHPLEFDHQQKNAYMPAVGTACFNDFIVKRAMQAVICCIEEIYQKQAPYQIGFVYDTRFFSTHFAELCASICQSRGWRVVMWQGARSTPQLSFLIRSRNLDAGIAITASHNPYHDNGLKVYLRSGEQVLTPNANKIIGYFNQEGTINLPNQAGGKIDYLTEQDDAIYRQSLHHLVLYNDNKQAATKVLFTNLHGTGGHISVPLLKELGFQVATVAEQDKQDSLFPTVQSPNPENKEAFSYAIEQAKQQGIHLIMGTDPDADRLGIVAQNQAGDLAILTGNQIGSLLLWYRLKILFEQQILNEKNKKNAACIKTFVTSSLQDKIATTAGISIVNTPTGFKYIAAKLDKYENMLSAEQRTTYRNLDAKSKRDLMLSQAKWFVFGGEESYGYAGDDAVRDKDANAAVAMVADLYRYACSQNKTLFHLLDELYLQFGYHQEKSQAITMAGATGQQAIQNLMSSYLQSPPTHLAGEKVTKVVDYTAVNMTDNEGDTLEPQAMIMVHLANQCYFAIRPSGTEPKIKYYLFGCSKPTNQLSSLQHHKTTVNQQLEKLWEDIEKDSQKRLQ